MEKIFVLQLFHGSNLQYVVFLYTISAGTGVCVDERDECDPWTAGTEGDGVL